MTRGGGPKARPKAVATRQQLREQRGRQQATELRRRRRFAIVLVAVLVLAVVGVGLAVTMAQRQTADKERPAGVTSAGGGISVGPAKAPVLDLYEDYQCVTCKQFEASIGPIVEQLVAQGKLRVVYHPLSFLDSNLDNTSSGQAAAAGGCAQDQGVYVKFHDTVFAHQPSTTGQGYAIADIMAFGREAGVKDLDAYESCVNHQTYHDWVTQAQARADAIPVTEALTIFLDGKAIDLSGLTPQTLTVAVATAADALGTSTPSSSAP
jgi:protein-disulfide isomerase